MQTHFKFLKKSRLTEQERLNLFLYNNKTAHKDITERGRINITLFEGNTWSVEKKKQYYSKAEYKARNW